MSRNNKQFSINESLAYFVAILLFFGIMSALWYFFGFDGMILIVNLFVILMGGTVYLF